MLFSQPFDKESPRVYRISSVALFGELRAVEIGYNRTPKELYQVMKRDVYILHYITKGCGVFCGERFAEGNGYVVVPNELETVVADKETPYESYWIMFKGTNALDFLKKCDLPCHNGVFECSRVKECADILRDTLFNIAPSNEFEEAAVMNAALHKITALHFGDLQATVPVDSVPRKVMRFINENYYNNITMESIAKSFNFSRNYLYMLFKNDYNISPQAYLLNLRMEKAKELLLNESHLSISEVALDVGYNDALYFSRVFRKKVGVSPTEFIRMHK